MPELAVIVAPKGAEVTLIIPLASPITVRAALSYPSAASAARRLYIALLDILLVDWVL